MRSLHSLSGQIAEKNKDADNWVNLTAETSAALARKT
jgi:hypothetical protein